ncbi:hypothetical protein IJH33_02180 [Candidatus Saccharibacteria bacterium]|nr:hypothetical protein [Candidatus Saccharibacteria bacterium]
MLTPIIRVLTAKIIEVEPYPWLDFLEKSSKKLAPELVLVLNSELRGEMAKDWLYIRSGGSGWT